MRNVRTMDSVLTGARPSVTTGDAVRIAAQMFGIQARAAIDLGSERDRTFALLGSDDQRLAILKVSNPSEDPEVLDMEAEAALHVAAVDPELGMALPWRTAATGTPGTAQPGDDPALLRAEWSHGEMAHWVRAYDVLPGRSWIAAIDLGDAALIAWGDTTARLALALRAFTHPRARRTMLWDVQHALASRTMLEHIRDPGERALVARVLDRVRADGDARLAEAARSGRPYRSHRRQHPDRRCRPDHRDHRLRRHEPLGADHRPGLGARLARRRTGRPGAVPRWRVSSSTATSGGSSSKRLSCVSSAWRGRRAVP